MGDSTFVRRPAIVCIQYSCNLTHRHDDALITDVARGGDGLDAVGPARWLDAPDVVRHVLGR
jgi:hypothetical protein